MKLGLIRRVLEARMGLVNEDHADDKKRANETSAKAYAAEQIAIRTLRKDASQDRAARIVSAVANAIGSAAAFTEHNDIATVFESSGRFGHVIFASMGDGQVAEAKAAAAKRIADAARGDARSSSAASSTSEDRLREIMRNLRGRA